MPIYEYRCEHCDHCLEALQKISDAPLTECPACGKASLKKLVSASAFRLKGGGWYETDFKDKNKKNLAADGQGAASDGGAKSGDGAAAAGTESAPAPAAATGGDASGAKPAAGAVA